MGQLPLFRDEEEEEEEEKQEGRFSALTFGSREKMSLQHSMASPLTFALSLWRLWGRRAKCSWPVLSTPHSFRKSDNLSCFC